MIERPTTPDSHVVRRMGSDKTHVMVVQDVVPAVMFGASYWMPLEGRAACGVMIRDGVVMQPGTVTRCSTCNHLTGVTYEGSW